MLIKKTAKKQLSIFTALLEVDEARFVDVSIAAA
jgi:hypothetical protein